MPDAFIQIVEVWVPVGDRLRLASAAYGPHREFALESESLTFHIGQGLPGAAWRTGRAEVWEELDLAFVRHELAERAGIDAGVAFPVYRGDAIEAIVVLLCGSREHTGGCIEVWEPNELRELELAAGYYGNLLAFEEISRLLRFQRGRGLPGVTWETGAPSLMGDLGNTKSFVRALAARASGIQSGIGIPLHADGAVAQVLLLLSARATPLARAFEIWSVEPTGALRLSDYLDAERGSLRADLELPVDVAARRLAEHVRETGLPRVCVAGTELLAEAQRLGVAWGLGLPIHDGERLRAVVNVLG